MSDYKEKTTISVRKEVKFIVYVPCSRQCAKPVGLYYLI